MEYKWEYNNKQHKEGLLKRIYGLSFENYLIEEFFTTIIPLALTILFAFLDDSGKLSALFFAWTIISILLTLATTGFSCCAYFYSDAIHFPVKRKHPLYKEFNYRNMPLRLYANACVFQIFKYSEIKECYWFRDRRHKKNMYVIMIKDIYGYKWDIEMGRFSGKQVKYICSILKKYAGSKSGIPAEEFKKRKKKSK